MSPKITSTAIAITSPFLPVWVVRTDVQLTAPYNNNWTQLSFGDQRCVIKEAVDNEHLIKLSCGRLRAGIWICYALELGELVAFLARVQTRIETIEIALHDTFFAVLTLARYVNSSTVSVGVRQ
jgi:hypothetical protein